MPNFICLAFFALNLLYNISMQRDVIVLGGNGFLGSNLCNKLDEQGISAYVLDKALKCDLSTSSGQQMFRDIVYDCNQEVDVVMMAAQLGAKLFDETPIEPFNENLAIDMNTIDSIKKMHNEHGIKFHVTYYSTSEVYGNMLDYSRHDIYVDPKHSRSLYAQEKLIIETLLNYMKSCNEIESLRIFRPFNVSGKNQKRGVIYEMVKSAVEKKCIFYPLNQSREITFVQDATDIAFKHIVDRTDCTIDLTSRFHISLKDLAYCVKRAIEKTYPDCLGSIETVEMPKNDSYIKHRGTAPLINDADQLNRFIEKMIEMNIVKDISKGFL